jgi:hypothetical protein
MQLTHVTQIKEMRTIYRYHVVIVKGSERSADDADHLLVGIGARLQVMQRLAAIRIRTAPPAADVAAEHLTLSANAGMLHELHELD